MSRRLTRRTALATLGILSSGISGVSSTGAKERSAVNPAPGSTPIRQAINIRRIGNESPVDMIRRVKEAGYTAIKGARHPGGNVGEPWHSMTPAERAEIKAICRKLDVVIYEVGGYTNLITPDEEKRKKNLAGLAHCLEVAESVGCPMVGTVAGCRDPRYLINVHPDNWSSATWNLLVKSIRQVIRDTAGMKAVIGMEAQVTTIIDGPRAHLRLMEELGNERVRVNLDPANMVSLHNYYHTTELIHECFDLLGENIMGCHAKDTYIIPDRQTVLVQEVCPGKGVLDYRAYLARMSRLAWPRALEPEHIADDEYPEAKAYIERVAKETGVRLYR